MIEHFGRSPEWGWYIVAYFFLGGIAGGAYLLGTLLRLLRDPRDEPVARLAFVLSFATMAVCPVLLTIDLGKPSRFWHMLVDPTGPSINFNPVSPMSVGVWILSGFGMFSTIAFVDALAHRRLLRDGAFSRAFHVVGAVLGLALAGYTGVLLSVTSVPLWSDTWVLGGLFLASGLSVAVAALGLLSAWRGAGATTATTATTATATTATAEKLRRVAGWFLVVELALLVLFFATLGRVGPRYVEGPWIVLWLLVLAGVLLPMMRRIRPSPTGNGVAGALLVLAAGLALRIAVVFGPQT